MKALILNIEEGKVYKSLSRRNAYYEIYNGDLVVTNTLEELDKCPVVFDRLTAYVRFVNSLDLVEMSENEKKIVAIEEQMSKEQNRHDEKMNELRTQLELAKKGK